MTEPTETPMTVECYVKGLLHSTAQATPDEWEEFLEGLELRRREFGALLDAGMSRKAANEEMIRRETTR